MFDLPLKKGETGNICKGTPDIEFEKDWSVDLGATLRDRQKIENCFSSFTEFFSGKADSGILLGFECTINPQNLMKIVGAIFEKIKILYFFLCELPLILKKWAKDICKGTLDIERERDWPVGLGATLGDEQKIKKIFL